MTERVVPMIHVPDVNATVDWYSGLGFTVVQTYGDDGQGLSFAILSFGNSQVMFNQGGQPSTRQRREVDLYIYANDVDDFYQRLKDRVEVVEAPHDTFYGMREFIFRDLNRFWITCGQPSAFEVLMTGVREGNVEMVQTALNRGGLKPETLAAALAVISSRDNISGDKPRVEIRDLLKKAGGVPPPEVDVETLESYVGEYRSDQGFAIKVSLADGKLFAAPGAQQP